MDVTSATSATDVFGNDSTGFNGLTADDFFTLLIAQLQNQDPTEPTSNEQLLNQIATIRSLQSNVELGDVLKDVSSSLTASSTDFGQKLSVGASYIGQSVTLDDTSTGIVDRAFVIDGETYLGVDGNDVPISRVIAINTAESYVGQVILADIGESNLDGTPKPFVATVTGAQLDPTTNEKVLIVESPDETGQLVPRKLDPSQVKRVFNGSFLIGKQVGAVLPNGAYVEGVASETTLDGKSALQIKDQKVLYNQVTSVAVL
jgi:flagellar basal-body rod modification protein FlgD